MYLRRLIGGSRARRGFAALLLGSGVGNLLALALSPVITRLFDPSTFGSFTLLVAVAMVMTALTSLRLELAVPLPPEDSMSYAIVHAGLAVSGLIGTTTSVLFAFAGPNIGTAIGQEAAGEWLWVTPLMATAMSSFSVLNALAIRQGRYRAMARRNVIMVASSLGLQIVAGVLGYGLAGLIVGFALGQFLGAATLLVGSGLRSGPAVLGRSLNAIRQAVSRYRQVPMLLAPAGAINSLGLQIPVVLFAYYYSAEVVGWFGLTQRVLAGPVTLIGLSVAQVYLSEAASAKRQSAGQPSVYFWRASRLLLWVGTGTSLVLLSFGPFLFELVFGTEWRPSGDFARALALALAAQLVAAPLSQTLVIFERNGLQLAWDVLRVATVFVAITAAALAGLTAVQAVWVLSGTLVLTYILSWELSRRTLGAVAG